MDHRVRGRLRRHGRIRAIIGQLVLRHRHGFGQQEINHNTSSTSNVYLDGKGHLVLKAINSGGSWTAARIESTRDDFQAPSGGELEMIASIEQPDPAHGMGYWPASGPSGRPCGRAAPWPAPARST